MCNLQHRSFVGDVTALQLCSLCESNGENPQDCIVAGMGAQLLVYQLSTGTLVSDETIFSAGVHIHGIHAVQMLDTCLLAVHGDRVAQVVRLKITKRPSSALAVESLIQLGPFAQWTMDCKLSASPDCDDQEFSRDSWSAMLEIGLSDNSVQTHKLQMQAGILVTCGMRRCECSEHSLLYSMSLLQHASSGETWVAAGTIFLDVLVWKACRQGHSSVPLYRLKGHEGSIHRVSWNGDGSQLMSASDDRTVRVWTVTLPETAQAEIEDQGIACLQAAPVLYGHSSRLWDCQFGEGFVISASEDCTARVWDGTTGKQLCSLQGHKGRGVWRCLLHPDQDRLITAGADSSIKIWRLADWMSADHPLAAQTSDAFTLPLLPTAAGGPARSGDSKAEWVRCMKLTDDFQLYLSTNQGCLYSLQPAVDKCTPNSSSSSSSSGGGSSRPEWRLLYSSPRKAAITCMQVLHTDRQWLHHSMSASPTASDLAGAQRGDSHWVVFGDGIGIVTCLGVQKVDQSQSRVTAASRHSQHPDVGLTQERRPAPAIRQDGAVQTAEASVSTDSEMKAQASETQTQVPSSREDSATAEHASRQPDQCAEPRRASSLPNFSWVAHPGSPVLAVFHPSTFGPRHVFTTSIAGAPMRWWLLPERHTSSSAAAGQVTAAPDLSQSEQAAQDLSQSEQATENLSQSEHSTQDLLQSEHATHPAGYRATAAQTAISPEQALLPPMSPPSQPSSRPHSHFPAHGRTPLPHETPMDTSASSTTAGQAAHGSATLKQASYSPLGGQLSTGYPPPQLLAEVAPIPGRGSQIVAMDACCLRHLLVCGDMAGNVMAFTIPDQLLQEPQASGGDSPTYQLRPCTILKQQHGKAVALVKLTRTDIMTAGTDGRICRYHWRLASTQPDTSSSHGKDTALSLTLEQALPFIHQSDAAASNADDCQNAAADSTPGSEGIEGQGRGESRRQHDRQASQTERKGSSGQGMSLVCVAEERLPNITTVQDIVQIAGSNEQLVCGFQSADWVVFNTHQQLELMRVTCGGWRRPFAFHCTSATNLIFTYHQPRIGTTHVHRRGPARPRLTPTPAQGVLQDPQAAQPAPSTAEGMNHNQTVHSPKESDRAEGVSGQQTSEQGVRTGASEPDGGPAWGSGSRGGGGGEPVTSLHAVHHGREVLCCALLQQVQSQLAPPTDSPSSDSPSSDSPSSDSPSSNSPSSLSSSLPKHATEPGSGKLEGCSMKEASPLCLLTGSEDGSMRQLLYSPPTVSASCSSLKSREAAAEQGRSEGDGNTPDEGQAGSGKKQKRKAGRESDRQQRGLFGGDEVGFQAAGSAVKSIVAMSFGAGQWLVVTAGAKEVLMAWMLQWRQNEEGNWKLSHQWLSTRPPPHRGLRPQANAKGQNSVSSDLRCMALAGWSQGTWQEDASHQSTLHAHIVTASSDATMTLLYFDVHARRWDTVQQLTHHATPVLSLCTVPLPTSPPTNPASSHTCHAPQPSAGVALHGKLGSPGQICGKGRGSTQLAWSGATNGSFAAWLLSSSNDTELGCHPDAQQAQQPQQQQHQQQPQQSEQQQPQQHQQLQSQRRQQQQQQEQQGRQHGRLVWSAEQWHQSGINAIHAAPTAGTQDCVTVVSGGDDQAIRVAVFQCCTSAPTTAVDGLPTSCMQLTLLSNCHIVSAHTSAIRGLWTDGHLAFTVALDQRLHCWQMKHHTELRVRHRSRSDSQAQPSLAHMPEGQTIEHAAENVVSDAHVWDQDAEAEGSNPMVCLLGSAVTQVLEPAALDAVYSIADQTYHVSVAGRGTQLLSMIT